MFSKATRHYGVAITACDWTNSMQSRDNVARNRTFSIQGTAACDFMFTLGDLIASGLQATVPHVACSGVA